VVADGVCIAKDADANWLSYGNMLSDSYHLEDKDGNRLSDDYLWLNPLAGSAGLYQFGIPAGHSDIWLGVLRLKDGKVNILVEAGTYAYRGIDAGEASVFFPTYSQGKYYDKDGNKIADLGAYLKPYGISVERDNWADAAIINATDFNYLPPTLAYNYRSNITRREYCYLAMAAYDRECGDYYKNVTTSSMDADDVTSPFTDVDDYYISYAANLGIVSGMGNGKFEPDRPITRQEAAVLLCNLAKVLNKDTAVKSVSKFADDASVGEWAKSYVYRICGIKAENGDGVMVGVGGNRFSPTTYYTREQAIVTIYRLLSVE
jgi:hypothetical protein